MPECPSLARSLESRAYHVDHVDESAHELSSRSARRTSERTFDNKPRAAHPCAGGIRTPPVSLCAACAPNTNTTRDATHDGRLRLGDADEYDNRCHDQQLLQQCGSSRDEKLLGAQSVQLIKDLEPTLSQLLEFKSGADEYTTLLDSVPVLALKFHPLNPRREWTRAEIPSILSAFALLASHSQRLNAFPELKAAFWLRVRRSKMTHTSANDMYKSAFRRPASPAFVVDFGGSHHSFTVDDALGDALVAFMTTPVRLPTPASESTSSARQCAVSTSRTASLPPPAEFGFVFRECNLAVASLEIIERFLDRTFASPDRQFGVQMLDLSKHFMNSDDLAVVACIVQKAKDVYRVEELRLDELIPGIMRTVFDVDALPALASSSSSSSSERTPGQPIAVATRSSSPQPPRLRKVSMSDNYVCPEFFAARFSALRYGCPLEEDVSRYATRNGWEPMKEDYFRWVAFGLFFPRPKRFAKRLRLRNIGHIQLTPWIIETFVKTLRNPAAQLVFNGESESGGDAIAATTELLVCTVKAGASVDVFKTGSETTPTFTDTLAEQSELEAIYEKPDGSVCVVVPGVGLGWIRPEFVERIEREPLSHDRSEQDGRYIASAKWNTGYYAGTYRHSRSDNVKDSMCALLESVGRQFRSLSLDDDKFYDQDLLPFMLEHCTHLEHLLLAPLHISARDGDLLLDALSGPLGGRLLSLNLISCNRLEHEPFFTRLFAILSNVDNPPALREVRIRFNTMVTETLAMLHDVLQVNRTLELVEVSYTGPMYGGDRQQQAELARLESAFQGQVLQSSLSPETKLAFLSVAARGCKNRDDSAARSLDSWLLSSIFAFAADREVRRTLVLNDTIYTSGTFW